MHLSLTTSLATATRDRMAFSSNVLISSDVSIHGNTMGDLTINNGNSEYGMHGLMSVLKRILIDDPMKDFIP